MTTKILIRYYYMTEQISINIDDFVTQLSESKRDSYTDKVQVNEINYDGESTYLNLSGDHTHEVGEMFILSNFHTNAHLKRVDWPLGDYEVIRVYGKEVDLGEYLLVCPSY